MKTIKYFLKEEASKDLKDAIEWLQECYDESSEGSSQEEELEDIIYFLKRLRKAINKDKEIIFIPTERK